MTSLYFKAPVVKGFIKIPASVSAKIPTGKIAVDGTLNGFPFQSFVQKSVLAVSDSTYKSAGIKDGEVVPVEIVRIDGDSEFRIPAGLKKAFAGAPRAFDQWNSVTPIARRDWIFWISTAKKIETRANRIEKAIDMLSSGKKRVCCFAGVTWLMKTGKGGVNK